MSDMPLVVAITGHRPDKLGGYKIPNPTYDLVLQGLVAAYNQFKPAYIISGMALGVDQWAAELAFNMNIPFVAAIPFDGQESKWPPASKSKYQWLLSLAFQRVFICDPGYAPWKMHKRNEWMMQSCHQVIAVWNGTPGGTAGAVAQAQQLGKPVHYVPLPAAGIVVGETFAQAPKFQPPVENTPPPPVGTKRIIDL